MIEMNDEDKQKFFYEYYGVADKINDIKNTHEAVSLREYINSSSASKNFFKIFDVNPREDRDALNMNFNTLQKMYTKELDDIIKNLGNDKYTDEQIILNFLEYIRVAGTYENLKANTLLQPGKYHDYQNIEHQLSFLSQCRANILLLGKGVCYSQALLLKDLMEYSNMSNKYRKFLNTDTFGATHEVVVLRADGYYSFDTHDYIGHDDEVPIYIDPTNYNGTTDSLEKTYDFGSKELFDRVITPKIEYSNEDIECARKNALEYLTQKYRINELFSSVDSFNKMELDKKLQTILDLIKSKTIINNKLKFGSIILNEKEFEMGKFFEMLCFSANIPYKIECEENRYKTTYHIQVDNNQKSYNFEDIYMQMLKEHKEHDYSL